MYSLLAPCEEAACYFPPFADKVTEAYRNKQPAQVQVDCGDGAGISAMLVDSRDLCMHSSVQLGSSSRDLSIFCVAYLSESPETSKSPMIPSPFHPHQWLIPSNSRSLSLYPSLPYPSSTAWADALCPGKCTASPFVPHLLILFPPTHLTQADLRWWTVSVSSWQTRGCHIHLFYVFKSALIFSFLPCTLLC